MKRCRFCSQEFFDSPLLRYEDMPGIAQNFPDERQKEYDRGVDLEVVQCSGCGLIQLNSEPVPYFKDVIRASAVSAEMSEFRLNQFSKFLEKYNLKGKKIIEVGCGRGEYLSLMQQSGADAYGLEHLNSSVAECLKKGLSVSKGFIEKPKQSIENAPFDAFFVLSFLEHIPDLNSFLQGIHFNLAHGAIGLVEVPNFDMILRDQMYYEFMTDHLYYFTKNTLNTVLNLNGFEVLECSEVWHSYILSAVVRKKSPTDLSLFDEHQKQLQYDIDKFLNRFPSRSVAVWGAGHQSLAVLSLAKLGGRVKYVLDSASFKQGRFTPSTHLPIVSPKTIQQDLEVKAVLVMGASYTDEIVADLKTNYRDDLAIAALRTTGVEIIES